MTEGTRTIKPRYPGLDILSQQKHWDRATRELILERVYHPPPIRFFSPREVEILQALADTILPQDDRPPAERIPIVPWIDASLYNEETPGYRLETMPDPRTAWRWGIEGIEQTSKALYDGRSFVELDPSERHSVIEALAQPEPPGEIWRRLPPKHFCIGVLTGAIINAYYSHPTAWNEIGYGGPAYPRGYYALNEGAPEQWEVQERR